MPQVIIYKQDNGVIAVLYPAPEALAAHGINAIAQKDVPSGKPYKITNSDELPDRAERNQWTVDDADLVDGIGSESNQFGV